MPQATYAGNRAPFPIYIHVYWLKAADNIEQLQRFIGRSALAALLAG